MGSVLLKYKEGIFKAAAFFFFHAGGLELFLRFVSRFQCREEMRSGSFFPGVAKRRSRNIQILTYHRVNDERDPFFPAIPTAVFESQMTYLASHFNVCSLEEALERMKKKDIPENAVVITFDDGYRDNYLNAFPILKRLGIPATIFLATDAIGSGRTLWHDVVFSAFRETRLPLLGGFGNDSREHPLRTLDEKLAAQRAVLEFLRSLEEGVRSFWIERLLERLKVDRIKGLNLMLTWDEVKAMHKSRISFGSHTATHPILSRLSTDRASEEIYGSKRVIEEVLGAPVTTFAYPNGREKDFTDLTKKILKEAGYACAVSTIFGSNYSGQDLFALRRGTPWEEDLPRFALKLAWYKFQL